MAKRKIEDLEKELKKIEVEEKAIEKIEKKIEEEEKTIEQKEDLLRLFEELGLMRWKSYYILTAGAILLLSLTFVAALWVMHDQISDINSKIPPQKDWCPAGSVTTIKVGERTSVMNVIGREIKEGREMCHIRATISTASGVQITDVWFDEGSSALVLSPNS